MIRVEAVLAGLNSPRRSRGKRSKPQCRSPSAWHFSRQHASPFLRDTPTSPLPHCGHPTFCPRPFSWSTATPANPVGHPTLCLLALLRHPGHPALLPTPYVAPPPVMPPPLCCPLFCPPPRASPLTMTTLNLFRPSQRPLYIPIPLLTRTLPLLEGGEPACPQGGSSAA